jgi:DNA-binding transcriptional ArsR family regulator
MTRHIRQEESLRTSLREESVSFLRLLQVHDERVSEDALSERILYIQSLLDATFHSGLISQINYTVVRKEYEALEKFLRGKDGVFGSTETVVGDVFFDVPEPSELTLPKPPQNKGSAPALVKDNTVSKGQTTKARPAPKKKSSQVVKRQSNRRTTILDLLKRKSKVSVRDVAEVVVGVSEKTLQRELLALVQEGIVIKEGERRWSTYSLK